MRSAGCIAPPLGWRESETKRKLAGEQVGRKRAAVDSALAHCGERRREVALGEAAAVGVRYQWMVQVGRLREPEQRLQQSLDRRRGPQVRAANDERDPALCVVDDAGEMIR